VCVCVCVCAWEQETPHSSFSLFSVYCASVADHLSPPYKRDDVQHTRINNNSESCIH